MLLPVIFGGATNKGIKLRTAINDNGEQRAECKEQSAEKIP